MRTPQAITTSLLLSLLLTLPTLLLTNPARPAAATSAGPRPDPPRAPATTITVTTTADERNTDGDCSLREAVQAANTGTAVDACPPGTGPDTIILPAGTYTLSLGGPQEDANAEGDLDVTGTLTLAGAGSTTTIIQGGTTEYNGIDRVFHLLAAGHLTIQDVTIRYGRAVNGGSPHINGGGIYVGDDARLNLRNTTITRNTGSNGGGITTASGALVEIEHSTISFNVGGSGGGGLNLGPNGTVHVDATTFHSNRAAFGGGALFGGTIATVSNSTFSANVAREQIEPPVGYGGAIQNHATATIANSTISGNTALDQGGAVRNFGTLHIGNSTLAANDAPTAGGIANLSSGSVTIASSIVAGNTGGDCNGTITSQGYNLAGDNSCTLTGPGDMNNTSPLLAPLQNNGGPTHTHALRGQSPAVDAGSNDICPATDQRGTTRPRDGNADSIPICDIGAYEAGAKILLPLIQSH